jgi:hypothetical protein
LREPPPAITFRTGDRNLDPDRKVPAASLFSGPYYFLEQLGFRKIIDTTFMMASL